ncbi:MAG: flagellar hook-length control protein FliK [Oscillospiraceae bacterium]|jgi:flagellar hook-length control protein FliK|nr:flagellar hook-length control protein FliK [Oscillospiraceae bacterium]
MQLISLPGTNSTPTVNGNNAGIKPAASQTRTDSGFSKMMEKTDSGQYKSSGEGVKSAVPRKDGNHAEIDTEPTEEVAELVAAVSAVIQQPPDNTVKEIVVEETVAVDETLELIPDIAPKSSVLAEITQLPQGSGNESFVSVLEGTDVNENIETMARMPNTSEIPADTVTTPTKDAAVASPEVGKQHSETIAASRPLENVNESGEPETNSVPALQINVPIARSSEKESPNTTQDYTSDAQNNKSEETKTPEVNTAVFNLAPKQVAANESFNGSVGVSEQTQTVAPNQLYDKIVESAELIRGSQSDTMTLQLKPEHLGKVEIQLVLSSQGSLTLKVTADDQNVRGMLNSQIGQLVDSLNSKGMKVESAEVVYSGVADDLAGKNANQGQQENGRQSRRPVQVARSADPVTSGYAYETYWGETEEVTEYLA